jgi:hypothetical protein
MTLDEIDLTDNLVWPDEYQFNQIEQFRDRSLTGGLIIQEGLKQYGRPITLEGWLPRATVDALVAKEATAGIEMTLTLPDERVFAVTFDRNSVAVEAAPIMQYTKASTDPAWSYQVVLRLLTVPGA